MSERLEMPNQTNLHDVILYGKVNSGDTTSVPLKVDSNGYLYSQPQSLHKELRVSASAAQESLTPSSGKRIRVFGIFVSQTITNAVTSTLRASISFGTGNTDDSTKVLWCNRQIKGEDTLEMWMGNLNTVGEIDETVTLTNITYSAGSSITRAVIYYVEE